MRACVCACWGGMWFELSTFDLYAPYYIIRNLGKLINNYKIIITYTTLNHVQLVENTTYNYFDFRFWPFLKHTLSKFLLFPLTEKIKSSRWKCIYEYVCSCCTWACQTILYLAIKERFYHSVILTFYLLIPCIMYTEWPFAAVDFIYFQYMRQLYIITIDHIPRNG